MENALSLTRGALTWTCKERQKFHKDEKEEELEERKKEILNLHLVPFSNRSSTTRSHRVDCRCNIY